MTPSDRASVGYLIRQLGYDVTDDEAEERIHDIRSRPDHLLLVADFGVTVGWVHAYEVLLLEEATAVEIGGLVVSDTARRRGSGTLLMQGAERWSLERGISHIRLRSNVKRKAAHRFYRAIGYREIKKSLIFTKELLGDG